MDEMYPPEAKNLNVIEHLEELRRRLLVCLGFLLAVTVVAFSQGHKLMRWALAPSQGLIDNLIFIRPTEVFTSYLKVSLIAGAAISMPVLLYEAWAFLSPAVSSKQKSHIGVWIFFAVVCCVLGVLFSYYGAFPIALRFFLGFAKGIAEPQITIEKYISFFGALMLIGSIVFEIPVVIGLLTDMGFLRSRILQTKRAYAVVIILIVAAVITPTQDIFNMLVFAVPMVLLYELGILIAKLIESKKKEPRSIK